MRARKVKCEQRLEDLGRFRSNLCRDGQERELQDLKNSALESIRVVTERSKTAHDIAAALERGPVDPVERTPDRRQNVIRQHRRDIAQHRALEFVEMREIAE